MSFRKCVTRDAPEKKIPGQSTRSKVMWYKSILWRLVHIQTWLVAPVAPVQLILRMLNALQSAIVQKISSVTWFTARSATTVLTARLICYSREQVRYWVVAINKDQFYLKILFLINAYDKQHLLSLHWACLSHKIYTLKWQFVLAIANCLVPGGGAIDHVVPSLIGWLYTKAPRRLNAAWRRWYPRIFCEQRRCSFLWAHVSIFFMLLF